MAPNPYIHGIELILASQSPRRRELLTNAGFPHRVQPANIPELLAAHESPTQYVARLAAEKAAAIPREAHQAVLAADTTVTLLEGTTEHVLEKPADADDAYRMLALLSGRPHFVHTGVCVAYGTRQLVHVETTLVHFAPLTEADIRTYIATGEPFDKAGAYGIQGHASRFVSRVEGCYFNIVGLPVHAVTNLLREAGLLATA